VRFLCCQYKQDNSLTSINFKRTECNYHSFMMYTVSGDFMSLLQGNIPEVTLRNVACIRVKNDTTPDTWTSRWFE
jgi:hypothetical protein